MNFDPLAAAQAIVPGLRATAADSEARRQLSADAAGLLRTSGLMRLMTPRRYGGHELPPRAQILTCAITAKGCSAASWVQMVCGAHTFIVGRFPRQCQDEVFGEDPDVFIPGTPAAQGTVAPVTGGWLLNGRWQFCSGVDHGPWLIMGARGIADDAGEQAPNLEVVVPASDMRIVDTWHVLGMRGTGSKDIVAENVFVPRHRGAPLEHAMLGTMPDVDRPLYRLPIGVTLASMLTGSVLGIAERGLELFLAHTQARRDRYVGGQKAVKPAVQMRLAEAAGEIALARSLVERNCAELDAAMTRDEPPMHVTERGQLRWNMAHAAELCRRAIERLYAGAGANAAFDANELQRIYRDINTAVHHAIVDFDTLAEVRGRLLLGYDEGYGLV